MKRSCKRHLTENPWARNTYNACNKNWMRQNSRFWTVADAPPCYHRIKITITQLSRCVLVKCEWIEENKSFGTSNNKYWGRASNWVLSLYWININDGGDNGAKWKQGIDWCRCCTFSYYGSILQSYDVQKVKFPIHLDKNEVGWNVEQPSNWIWSNPELEISKLVLHINLFKLVLILIRRPSFSIPRFFALFYFIIIFGMCILCEQIY